MSAVKITRDGQIARVLLNRPKKLNAFNAELVSGLSDAVAAAERDGVRLLVFSGAGKGFSGGFDLSDIDEMSDGDLLLRFVRVEEMLQAVHHAKCATLALVHGACYGAAADLVAACQWRVATPEARFRMPGSRFGLVLGTHRLANLVGADSARALLLRDRPFGAEEALGSGFLTDIADEVAWSETEQRIQRQAETLNAETFSALSERMIPDTRNADLAALVRAASHGSVKARVRTYLDDVAAAREAR